MVSEMMRDSQTVREVETDKQLEARCQWAMLYSKSSNLNSKALSRDAYWHHSSQNRTAGKFKSACLSSTRRTLLKIGLVSLENSRTLPHGPVQHEIHRGQTPAKLNQAVFTPSCTVSSHTTAITTYVLSPQLSRRTDTPYLYIFTGL